LTYKDGLKTRQSMGFETATEYERLAGIAQDSWYSRSANAAMIRYSAAIWRRYWRGGSAIELGPAEGLMTDIIVDAFDSLTVVDGSEAFCSGIRERHPNVNVVHSLFEEFEPDQPFDAIFLGHVLEHVEDPVQLLVRTAEWLTPSGSLYAAVPNARSIHRQAAVLMGLLSSVYDLNDSDRHHGHRRVYDPESLQAHCRAAGLNVDIFGGYWLKPIANGQIERDWTEDMLDAFMKLGERYPDIAAEIYVVASRA
jgi:trans-aconitate methyltransferase